MASAGQDVTARENHRVGENWSGSNPIPTVQKFIERLDVEKKQRDQRIDEEERARKDRERLRQKQQAQLGSSQANSNDEISAHQAREIARSKVRTVTDPTTGKEIGVEDQGPESMEAVKNPMVRQRSDGSCPLKVNIN